MTRLALLALVLAASPVSAQTTAPAASPTQTQAPADPAGAAATSGEEPHATSPEETAPAPSAPQAAAATRTYSPEIEEQTRALAAELRCPVCQGLSIEDSPTELSLQMKDVIRQQLAEGKTPDEVRAYFVGRYGEWILLQPRAAGFNLLVYALPLLGLVLGGGVIFLSVRRWTRRDPEADALAAAPAPADEPAVPA